MQPALQHEIAPPPVIESFELFRQQFLSFPESSAAARFSTRLSANNRWTARQP